MELEIVLNANGETPIYEQIETQIKDQIVAGRLKSGDSIPSMRALAKMLLVSVITVQKAYENLKREGWIESVVGRGTIVAWIDEDRIRKEKRNELEDEIREVLALSQILGMTKSELIDLILDLDQEEL
ncbi:MAG: GntR family transcriptional regulator [Allobaculum sp.]